MLSDLMETDDPYDDQGKCGLDLETKYKNILERFLVYLDTNFDDFVSLDHLGNVLQYLKSKSNLTIQRIKPPYLDYSIPNLIICPEDEILKRTLNIYMLTQNQPLPTDDEILYCNSNTTFEEIDLFWKRVLNFDESDEEKNSKNLLFNQRPRLAL